MILGNLLLGRRGKILYLIFRVLVGGLFLQHGLAKFGIFGGDPVSGTLFIVGGIAEILIGIGITIGLLTRLAAVFGMVTMIGAYLIIHASKGILPVLNGGEMALIFLATFICILAYGSGKYGIEKKILRREIF